MNERQTHLQLAAPLYLLVPLRLKLLHNMLGVWKQTNIQINKQTHTADEIGNCCHVSITVRIIVEIKSRQIVKALVFCKTSVCRRSFKISFETRASRWFAEDSCELQTFTVKASFETFTYWKFLNCCADTVLTSLNVITEPEIMRLNVSNADSLFEW